MNLKKAREYWGKIDCGYKSTVDWSQIWKLLEALAEKEEGEEVGEIKPLRVIGLKKKCLDCGYYTFWLKDEPEPQKCWYCKNCFDKPAFQFGDLVKEGKDYGVILDVHDDDLWVLKVDKRKDGKWHCYASQFHQPDTDILEKLNDKRLLSIKKILIKKLTGDY